MDSQASHPLRAHSLDKAVFWLRWLFLLSAASLALLSDTAVLGAENPDRERLIIGLIVAGAANLLLGLLSLLHSFSDRLLGIAGVVLDSLLAVLFVWVYDGAAAPLLILGALAVIPAAFRFQWRGVLGAILLLACASLLLYAQLDNPPDGTLASLGISLGLLLVLGALTVVLRLGGWIGHSSQPTLDEREAEANRLRTVRERARAIYQMANTLTATLDYRRVLEAAQDIGSLGLGEISQEARLISAVMLFQGEDNKLRVVSCRGLTRADEQAAVPGRRGVLGLALKQTEPVFAGDAIRDPELRYFVAFQDTKSVLAVPLRAGFDNYGVLVFGCDQPNAFSDEHVELLTTIGTQVTMALQNAVLYQNLLNEKERIVEVEEDARKKLSRDLHDGPTQSVAAIAMRVNYIRRLLERQPQQAVEELWKVEELARRTTKEIRHMLFTMRPLVLETQGLIAALDQLAEKMRTTYDTNVVVQPQPDIANYIDTHGQGVLFYIIEEAVNNARKHAQAEQITVRLYKREAFAVIEIEDNGVGFDVGAVDASYDQRGSLGMVNMRERAALIEGTLHIQSATGRGTKITVLLNAQEGGETGAITSDAQAAPPLQLQSLRNPTTQTRPPDNN